MIPRLATPADVPDIAALHVQAWEETYDGLLPPSEFARRNHAFRLALWAEVIASGAPVSLLPHIGFAQIAAQRDTALRAAFPRVFQIPIADEFGWLRADFSLAIAIQNLAWGFGQPIFGAIAEKIGDRKAIVLGALCYAAGLLLSSGATTPLAHQAYEVLVGFGIAGTGFGVILAVVGRAASDENRSMALAIATAAGSAGQVFGAPLAEYLLTFLTWQMTFVAFAGLIMSTLLVLPMMRSPQAATKAELEESIGTVLKRAFKDPSYTLIFLGFFSCGYQLAFITAHFPAFVTEMCGPIAPGGTLAGMGITTTSALGAVAISLIGLANIGGTLYAGYLGKRYPKKYLLAGIYVGRTLIAAAFILIPMTPTTVILAPSCICQSAKHPARLPWRAFRALVIPQHLPQKSHHFGGVAVWQAMPCTRHNLVVRDTVPLRHAPDGGNKAPSAPCSQSPKIGVWRQNRLNALSFSITPLGAKAINRFIRCGSTAAKAAAIEAPIE